MLRRDPRSRFRCACLDAPDTAEMHPIRSGAVTTAQRSTQVHRRTDRVADASLERCGPPMDRTRGLRNIAPLGYPSSPPVAAPYREAVAPSQSA